MPPLLQMYTIIQRHVWVITPPPPPSTQSIFSHSLKATWSPGCSPFLAFRWLTQTSLTLLIDCYWCNRPPCIYSSRGAASQRRWCHNFRVSAAPTPSRVSHVGDFCSQWSLLRLSWVLADAKAWRPKASPLQKQLNGNENGNSLIRAALCFLCCHLNKRKKLW